jgi:hypothetical protein
VPLSFTSREQWGAKPPARVTKRDPSTLSGVAIHWFGSPRAAKSHSGCAGLLLGCQLRHRRVRRAEHMGKSGIPPTEEDRQ